MALLQTNDLNLNEICLLYVLDQNSDNFDLNTKITEILPSYMKPRTTFSVRELFKNAAGKLDRARNFAFYLK